MALNHTIPELWRAALKQNFRKANIWTNYVTDVSSELAQGGDTLHIQEVTSAGAIADYTKEADIPAATYPSDTDQTLVIDQMKTFNIAIDDVDRVQARPDVMEKFTENTMAAMARVVDADLSNVWQTGVALVSNNTDANQTFQNPSVTEDATQAQLDSFIKKVNTVLRNAENRAWPKDRITMIVNTNVAAAMRQYLVNKGIGQGQLGDSVFLNGQMTSIFGIRTVVDPNASNATTNGTVMAKFVLNDALLVATQIRKVEAYRPERRFSDNVKGLFVWGRTLLFPDHRMVIIIGSG